MDTPGNLSQGGTPMAQATLAATERAVPAIRQTRLFINNEWVDPLDGTCFDLNPATGEVIASVAQGGAADIDLAVKRLGTR